MPPLLRAILAVVAGLIVGFIVVAGIEWISTMLFPLPEGVDPTDESQMREVIRGMPAGAMVAVLFAWFLGTLAGAVTAIRLHPARAKWAGMVVVGLFAAATVANMMMLPHPVWMMVAAPAVLILALVLALRLGEGSTDGEVAG